MSGYWKFNASYKKDFPDQLELISKRELKYAMIWNSLKAKLKNRIISFAAVYSRGLMLDRLSLQRALESRLYRGRSRRKIEKKLT